MPRGCVWRNRALCRSGPIRYGAVMRFAETDDRGGNLVRGYGPEGIRIGGQTYRGGFILTPGRIIPDWGPADPAGLAPVHLEALLALDPEVIILGTGAVQVFPDVALYRLPVARGVGIEVMDTGGACRTYNILMAEGRRVVVGFLPW
jgi:uncharacterized protein